MLTQDQLDRLAISLRAGEYNLLIGAGISLGTLGGDKNPLPTGEGLRIELCDFKGARATASLQKAYELLDANDVKRLITQRFSQTSPGPAILKIPSFPWRRIFTLNVDDAVETAYEKDGALQDFVVKNYKDAYEESRELTEVPIIHLHGYARQPDKGYVFSRAAYVNQLTRINPWLSVLSDILSVEPFVIIGTSLDEVDLDFYLSQRSHSTARKDVGPSVFVEPNPDAVFANDCEKHDLLPFKGTAEGFFEFLDKTVSDRRPPLSMVASDAISLFPSNTDRKAIAKFSSDFEVVPPFVEENHKDPRFLLGHEPSWNDLQSGFDVSREITGSIIRATETAVANPADSPQLLFYPDHAGGGKSTIMRRVAFDFARRGTKTLWCSPLGRLEPGFTASMLDLIDEPLLIVVDNFADQAGPVADIIDACEKRDVVFLCSERSYRRRYIQETVAGTYSTIVNSRSLSARETEALIKNYVDVGWIGSGEAADNPKRFAKDLVRDPIAVAWCRILNDFTPLGRIVTSVLQATAEFEKKRYLAAALAQFCITGGIRYDVLVKVAGGLSLSDQLSTNHPLPLAYSEMGRRSYIVPLNSVIASQVLESYAREERLILFDTFVAIARAVAPRVNRRTITRRSPEARLAGRLFDFDQVVEPFLGEDAHEFYTAVQDAWQWNSRYWEQVALLYLSRYFRDPAGDRAHDNLEAARQHARHAVSVETHPFSLTTLGKILLVQAQAEPRMRQPVFEEAFARLSQAIDLERRWSWTNTQAFVILYRGLRDLLPLGVHVSSMNAETIIGYSQYARRKFRRDRELMELIGQVESREVT